MLKFQVPAGVDTLEFLDEFAAAVRDGTERARVDFIECCAFSYRDYESDHSGTWLDAYSSEGARLLGEPGYSAKVSKLVQEQGVVAMSRLKI